MSFKWISHIQKKNKYLFFCTFYSSKNPENKCISFYTYIKLMDHVTLKTAVMKIQLWSQEYTAALPQAEFQIHRTIYQSQIDLVTYHLDLPSQYTISPTVPSMCLSKKISQTFLLPSPQGLTQLTCLLLLSNWKTTSIRYTLSSNQDEAAINWEGYGP